MNKKTETWVMTQRSEDKRQLFELRSDVLVNTLKFCSDIKKVYNMLENDDKGNWGSFGKCSRIVAEYTSERHKAKTGIDLDLFFWPPCEYKSNIVSAFSSESDT